MGTCAGNALRLVVIERGGGWPPQLDHRAGGIVVINQLSDESPEHFLLRVQKRLQRFAGTLASATLGVAPEACVARHSTRRALRQLLATRSGGAPPHIIAAAPAAFDSTPTEPRQAMAG